MERLEELQQLAAGLKVLYVEDDTNIANLLINYLSNFFSEVVYAENGKEALDMFEQDKFDLIITDIEMPTLDGLDLSNEIKKIDEHQHIIITTAYSDLEKLQTSIKLGIEGYLIKPINYNDMNNILYKISRSIKKDKELLEHQKRIEITVKELDDKNKQLEQYLDILDHVAIVSKTNLQGEITYVNDSFCEVSGYNKNELLGRDHNLIKHPDMSKNLYYDIISTIQNGQNWTGTVKNINKEKEVYFIHTTIVPMFDSNGRLKEYMGISFLTTKEEVEKREFKKKVMINYQEHRKNSLENTKKIEDLEEKLSLLLGEQKFIKDYNLKLEDKNKRLLSQITYYENEYSKMDDYRQKTIDRIDERITNLEQNNRDLKTKIQSKDKELNFLKVDVNNKKDKLDSLSEQNDSQRRIILDLHNTIKTLTEKEE